MKCKVYDYFCNCVACTSERNSRLQPNQKDWPDGEFTRTQWAEMKAERDKDAAKIANMAKLLEVAEVELKKWMHPQWPWFGQVTLCKLSLAANNLRAGRDLSGEGK